MGIDWSKILRIIVSLTSTPLESLLLSNGKAHTELSNGVNG